MVQKIKNRLMVLSALLFVLMPAVFTAGVSAQTPSPRPDKSICLGAENLRINTNTPEGEPCRRAERQTENRVNNIISVIINIFSTIVGIIAVIMIIYAGFKYITSGGSSERVTSAKNTLLYAVIGLVIVALAQIIVRFVLGTAAGAR